MGGSKGSVFVFTTLQTKGKISEKEQRLTDAVEKYKEEMQQNFIKLQKQDDNIRSLHQVSML